MSILKDEGVAQCLKQVVRATIVAADGSVYVATNHIGNASVTRCPREGLPTGVGYDLCVSVCGQGGHAEVNAVRLAGKNAKGGILYLEGHTYACSNCTAVATEAGIMKIIVGKPPEIM